MLLLFHQGLLAYADDLPVCADDVHGTKVNEFCGKMNVHERNVACTLFCNVRDGVLLFHDKRSNELSSMVCTNSDDGCASKEKHRMHVSV